MSDHHQLLRTQGARRRYVATIREDPLAAREQYCWTEIEAKIGKILQGADPPDCDRDVETMLAEAGFCAPELFFSSLFWGGWIAMRWP
jgi:hypothetical protein